MFGGFQLIAIPEGGRDTMRGSVREDLRTIDPGRITANAGKPVTSENE